MMPAQNPSAPRQNALRQTERTTRRYTAGWSRGTSANIGWSRSISRLLSTMASPNSGRNTSGIRKAVIATGMRYRAK